ncbi:hypothetical protein BB559_003548 [Furculomyces boomerangus]|uniref:NTF2 domain-containing protein n=2 Tax=Harpellales TaxID=61421 RepID=A0A2T9Y038_9FUNG|nr:hypothetical protein BB559_007047 [Furculomyces boomerangus]PVU85677.1 hypothetical protein BB559_006879 [Furculomyces boomerangus]PVU92913.1 hypothetical protein BB559_003548 [Furculomyces boomerangus]PVZ98020.1 hypothetical protein BB558_005989 [Smittium angustum]
MTSESQKTTTSNSQNDPKTDATAIGWYFVKEFYTELNRDPSIMSRFYYKDSVCIFGNDGESVTPAIGNDEIHKLFARMEFNNCKVKLTNVDSIGVAPGMILIQATGEMANEGKDAMRFVQTFLLDEYHNSYYCKNDILRFFVEGPQETTATHVESWKEAETESPIKPVENTQTVNNQPQQDLPPKQPVEVPETKVETPQQQPTPKAEAAPVVTQPVPPVQKQQPQNNIKKQQPPPSKPAQQPQQEKVPVSETNGQSKAEPTEPEKPKSWANLAAKDHTMWGKAVARVEGTVAVSQSVTPQAPSAPTQSSAQRSAPSSEKPKGGRKREQFPIYVKSIPSKVDNNALSKAFAKFGTVSSVELLNAGNAVIDFASAESQKKALTDRQLIITLPNSAQSFTLTIEERRSPVGRRDDHRGGRSSSGRGDFERSGGNRNRPGAGGSSGGRVRGGASKQ